MTWQILATLTYSLPAFGMFGIAISRQRQVSDAVGIASVTGDAPAYPPEMTRDECMPAFAQVVTDDSYDIDD